MANTKKILVIRNDKLGDFMLAWPALAFLKQQYPEYEITALVTPYTRDMADICPWIDKTLLDDSSSMISLSKTIRSHSFDISIALFTETRTALACLLSRIPVRLAPATKLAQFFSNRTLAQHRSQSIKPEYEYNIDLIEHLISLNKDKATAIPPPPYLYFDKSLTETLRNQYRQKNNIPDNLLLIIVHPGTGGSAINFSIQQYATLIIELSNKIKAHFIITAGPGEEETAEKLSALLLGTHHTIYHSVKGIVAFSEFIATCNLFISGSTGPLHIAGALNICTAAFYPARQSATSLRWQTTNDENHRIAFSPEKYTGKTDMETINPVDCAQKISHFIDSAHAFNN